MEVKCLQLQSGSCYKYPVRKRKAKESASKIMPEKNSLKIKSLKIPVLLKFYISVEKFHLSMEYVFY